VAKLSNSLDFLSTIPSISLYIKLIEQLNKDFQMAGILEEFSLESNPQDLVNKLQKTIRKMVNTQYSEYLNLLYRIDISEQNLANTTITDADSLIKQHSYLILKREWQKIYFRNKL